MFFFRARAGKGIAWYIDESSVVWTLIYHSKLANQIARLAAIVVKINLISCITVITFPTRKMQQFRSGQYMYMQNSSFL